MSVVGGEGGGRPRVVILGGGFAGVYTALALERALGERNDFEVVLVNRENYFVFQPMLPEVISGSIGLTDMVAPLRRLLRRSAVHVRDVETVDLESRVVSTSPGFRPHPHRIGYDHLVLGLGNVTDFRGLPGRPEHALPFKNLGDALRLRNQPIVLLICGPDGRLGYWGGRNDRFDRTGTTARRAVGVG